MMRGSPAFGCVLVMRPNEALFTAVAGLSKFTWLNTLNNSARNCMLMSLPKRIILNNPMSQLYVLGPV